MELLQAVKKIIRGRRRVPGKDVLLRRPVLDLGRGQLGGTQEEDVDRIDDHQRGNQIREVALQLKKRFADLPFRMSWLKRLGHVSRL